MACFPPAENIFRKKGYEKHFPVSLVIEDVE